ncbi:MAG TPA: phosphatidylserine decarboxylase [Vicinamibacterales bacterium]|jgi:phosphatidylserine decarboxylase
MMIDRAGYPFIAGALIPAVALAAIGQPLWSSPCVAVALAFLFFFRDPERHAEAPADTVISPADGRVMVAGPPEPNAAPPGAWTQVSVFLSPLDVHVNRIPVSGRVTRVDYHRGAFRAAYKPEATIENERNEIWIEGNGRTVVCRQITGVLVRRVVCRVKAGDEVRAGQRFGVMKFGSRIDLFLPEGTRLLVAPGDRVKAGLTRLATL